MKQEYERISNVLFDLVRFLHIWPQRGSKLRSILPIFNFTIMFMTILLNMAHLFYNLKRRSHNTLIIILWDGMVQSVLLTFLYMHFLYFRNRQKLELLFTHTEDFRAFGKPDRLEKVVGIYTKLVKITIWIVVIITPIDAYLQSLNTKSCEKNNSIYSDNDLCFLLVQLWVPFNNSFLAVIVAVLEVTAITHYLTSTVCMELIVHICTELILIRIGHLNKLLSKTNFKSLHNKLTKNFGVLVIPVQFAYSIVVSLCLILLVLDPKSTALVLLIIWTIILIGQSYTGQRLKDQSASLADTAYNLNWYDASIDSQKELMLFIIRSQTPLAARVSGIGGMSFTDMKQICTKAYSFLAVFLKMK